MSVAQDRDGAVAGKLLSIDMLNALVGDENGNGQFLESFLDEINAIAVHPEFTGSDPSLFDFVFSSQEGSGEAWEELIGDGDVFRFVPPTILGGDQPVEAFLEASIIQAGIGTTGNIDVDAIAFASDGTLFLSFRNDELILGDLAPLDDGAVVAFEPGNIVYDDEGNIENLGQGTVQVVLSEDSMDEFVTSAGQKDENGRLNDIRLASWVSSANAGWIALTGGDTQRREEVATWFESRLNVKRVRN